MAKKRHVIAADLHGDIELLERVLAHSGYSPDDDVLVSAGDAVDVGPRSREVLRRLDELHAVTVLGNHEFAHLIGQHLKLDDGRSATDTSLDWAYGLPARLAEDIAAGQLLLAYDAGGVLVTHAGLTEDAYAAALEAAGLPGDTGLAAAATASLLNALLPGFVRPPLYPEVSPYGSWVPGEHGWSLLGTGESLTPLWFRPGRDGLPSPRWPQVFGHTPAGTLPPAVAAWLGDHACFCIDPWDRELSGLPGYVRYALVEEGRAELVVDWEGRERGAGA